MVNGVFPSIVGLVLMSVTAYIWYRRKLLLRDGVRVTGTISGIEFKQSSNDRAERWFKIDFTDTDGINHQVSKIKGGSIRHLGEGDTLELVYPPGKPESAVLAGGAGGAPIIGGFILGLVFFIAPWFD
jgi:hypothetical protein